MPRTAQNAQQAQGNDSQATANQTEDRRGQWGQTCVSGAPTEAHGFSFERAAKVQCVQNIQYAISADSEESAYFAPLAAEAIRKASSLASPAPISPLLTACATALPATLTGQDLDEIFKTISIKYGQLQPCSNPDLRLRDEEKQSHGYVPESHYEMFKAPDHRDASKQRSMVQAPLCEGGGYYFVSNARAWPWTCALTGKIDLGFDFHVDKDGNDVLPGEVQYAWQLNVSKRSKAHIYDAATQKDRDYVISVSVGEINASTNNFVAWKTQQAPALMFVQLEDKDLMHKLFWQQNESGHHWPRWQELDEVPRVGRSEKPSVKYQLIEKDGCMALLNEPKGDYEPYYQNVCNFILLKLDRLLQFCEEEGGMGYVQIMCRQIINEDGAGIYLLTSEDSVRTPCLDGYWAIDVEVLVQTGNLRTTADVKKLFQSAYLLLHANIMTPDMLSCWITEQEMPRVTSCIVRFGRQLDDTWVSGNIAWREKKLLEHDEAFVAVIPQHFRESLLPMTKADYPRNIVIPQCHVRYTVLVNFWTNLMPAFFQNNTMPAKAVFALGVMGLYATKFWGGQAGFGHGFPFGWIFSTEPNTASFLAPLDCLPNLILVCLHTEKCAGKD